MANLLQLMPNLEMDEMNYVQMLVKDMSDDQVRQFATIYNSRRKDPQTILLGVAGIQRFIIDQIGMGLLYLFTGGICVIGTIVDLVSYKKLTLEYNQKIARQVSGMVASAN